MIKSESINFLDYEYKLTVENIIKSILIHKLFNVEFDTKYVKVIQNSYAKRYVITAVQHNYLNKLLVENNIKVLKFEEIRQAKIKYILRLSI